MLRSSCLPHPLLPLPAVCPPPALASLCAALSLPPPPPPLLAALGGSLRRSFLLSPRSGIFIVLLRGAPLWDALWPPCEVSCIGNALWRFFGFKPEWFGAFLFINPERFGAAQWMTEQYPGLERDVTLASLTPWRGSLIRPCGLHSLYSKCGC